MSNNASPVLNGYVCFYKSKRAEVYAPNLLAARNMAADLFNAKKAYEVTAVLAEKGGVPVVHSTASLG